METEHAATVVHPLAGIRRTIARRMTTAWETPVFHLSRGIDMSTTLARRARLESVTVSDIIVYACARALAENPRLNGHFEDDAFVEHRAQHIGLAVATDDGLVVPIIRDAGDATELEIAEQRRAVVARARSRGLTTADVLGATFTVSNLGMFGVEQFDAIVNPPQVAILAVGATAAELRRRDGEIVDRPIARFTLTCDHRVIDGSMGARFLQSLAAQLEATGD